MEPALEIRGNHLELEMYCDYTQTFLLHIITDVSCVPRYINLHSYCNCIGYNRKLVIMAGKVGTNTMS